MSSALVEANIEMKTVFALVLAASSALAFPGNHRFKHVVTVMLENRAYDHMLGGLGGESHGLSGNETQPLDPSDPSAGSVPYAPGADYIVGDPDHSLPGTTFEVYGNEAGSGSERMDGFAARAKQIGLDPASIIKYFTPEQVPVISTLAREFTLMDEWFSGFPGDTEPNRAFYHSGTTHGICDNDVTKIIEGWPQTSVYKFLQDKANASFGFYFQDIPDVLTFADVRSIDTLLSSFHFYADFEQHLHDDTLEDVVFLSPAFFTIPDIQNATDQHPSHDVIEGELFLKNIYDTLRNSPRWNDTLLIITYDEHGGFADLKAPPSEGVPSPDGLNCTTPAPFGFDRLGLRIPTILVSPWLESQVVHGPPAHMRPTPTSAYSASSSIATLRSLFNVSQPLTHRDAWATPFTDLLEQRTSPRTDCPTHMPTPPPGYVAQPAQLHPEAQRRLNGQGPVGHLHTSLLAALAGAAKIPFDSLSLQAMTEAEAGAWAREVVSQLIQKPLPETL